MQENLIRNCLRGALPGVKMQTKTILPRTILLSVFVLLCAGCAHQYGTVGVKPGETSKEAEAVAATCRSQADHHGGANGAAWIPFAGHSVAKDIRNEEFKKCVEAHGYAAIPPSD